MKRLIIVALGALIIGCAVKTPKRTMGWVVDPSYRAPTAVRMFLHGPPAEVEAVIADGRRFGWRSVEQSIAPSGLTFALVEGRLVIPRNGSIDAIVGARPVSFGPAMRIEQ